jgi:adenosylcobinamide kinase/adenosylcobinamide-phosphate guanylyltransferase
MGKQLTLILGGARSGKSSYAQSLFEGSREPVLFVATANAGDAEMAARIAAHRADRPSHWLTLEASLQTGAAIRSAPPAPRVLVDCVTMLASNVLMTLPEPVDEKAYQKVLDQEIDMLLEAYRAHPGEWVVISNEVGLGLVPAYPLGRYYRDALGRANQRLAQAADRVILMVAGIPMTVK